MDHATLQSFERTLHERLNRLENKLDRVLLAVVTQDRPVGLEVRVEGDPHSPGRHRCDYFGSTGVVVDSRVSAGDLYWTVKFADGSLREYPVHHLNCTGRRL